MKQAKTLLYMVLSLLVRSTVAQDIESYRWERGHFIFYFNPANMPPWIGQEDVRVRQLFLTEEAKLEYRIRAFEEMIQEGVGYWKSVEGVPATAEYAGRTNANCGDLADGISLVCWRTDITYFLRPDGNIANATTEFSVDISTGFIKEAEIYLNPIPIPEMYLFFRR